MFIWIISTGEGAGQAIAFAAVIFLNRYHHFLHVISMIIPVYVIFVLL